MDDTTGFDLTTIEDLSVDELAISQRIASELAIRLSQMQAVLSLSAEGCTIPFISRYRKERTENLDEVQVRDCIQKFQSYKNLEERRLEVLKGISALGKLDAFLYENIVRATTLAELEDLWAPFKKKKKTRGMIAQEKGLSPLAELMARAFLEEVIAAAPSFIHRDEEHPELSVESVEDALSGARDILAERLSQDTSMRAYIKDVLLKDGELAVKGIGDEEKREQSTYQMYWDYREPLTTLKHHRVLAVNRGEREGELDVSIEVSDELVEERLLERVCPANAQHKEAVIDGLFRLLLPAVRREIRSDLTESAESHAIEVFSTNLRNLLMQPPLRGTRVLGIDPGIRTGTKCAALDETGKFLDYFVINQETKPEQGKKDVAAAVIKHRLSVIAVGNGTGSHEVQRLVAESISENKLVCRFAVVDEDGASVYSASDLAREEFPALDLTIRGAISIGRRLQDPLSELVKIDPKSIGVGLYQHDVNQKKLANQLDEVVGSVVNQVGVNLNTASYSLLRYVSGINASLARKIVKFRNASGVIRNRSLLKEIPGLGEKTFEQCAGFLKIPESDNELDNTWVHPENYTLALEILPIVKSGGEPQAEKRATLKQKYEVGDITLNDIISELRKPNRDPREDLPPPLMQENVLSFEDLRPGLKVKGKVKNVVDFGAFVDIGIKESALIHVSEMAERFVKNPMEVLKVGDIKDFTVISIDPVRKRIGLSLRANPKLEMAHSELVAHNGFSKDRAEKRQGSDKRAARPPREDDGMTYNPFADLLRKK
ncbi:MAG: 30S ribosomal protein S1 [Spirochaetes bacterium ADurb.Bin110]|nr:MAG: 30S ribosomal protein S1 [Spirochaetes bacterium ADurb.Bin110]